MTDGELCLIIHHETLVLKPFVIDYRELWPYIFWHRAFYRVLYIFTVYDKLY